MIIDLNNKTYILQGLGNVGLNAAKTLDKYGMKLIGIGDHTGYMVDQSSINVNDLVKHVKNKQCVNNLTHSSNILKNKKEFFKTKCDVILPCALQMQILKEEAENIDCRLIVEGANGPLDNNADSILKNKNITVIPDIYANGGGVIVSYYEWLQNNMNNYYTQEEIFNKLENKLENTYFKLNTIQKKYNCTLRESAYICALEKLENSYKSRGLV